MAYKHLTFLAILKLVSSAAYPKPDPDIIYNQVLKDDGCGGNQCSPEREVDCDFGGQQFPHGSTQVLSCMKFKCVKGDWQYTGKVDIKNCGECQVFGEPQFLTYDDHNTWNPKNWYVFNGHTGLFTVSQSGLKDLPELTVTSMFEYEPNTGGETAARSVCYFEPEITVCVVLPSFELWQCFNSSDPNVYPECEIKVTVNGYHYKIGKDVKVFNALAGNVLVFDHNHHGIIISGNYPINGTAADNSQCINIVGSMGLSVSLCTSYSNIYDGGQPGIWSVYSHLYVWAMKDLKGQLYGLCDTYTGEFRNGYTMHNGDLTNNTDDFALSWSINVTALNRPSVNRCLTPSVFGNVKTECASITHDFCNAHPPKCAGFVSGCEFDLCRVSNPGDYAQGYKNHLKIETHLNQ